MAAKRRGGARKGTGPKPIDTPALRAALEEAASGKVTPEQAAERHGVNGRTVRRRMAASRTAAGAGSASATCGASQVVHLPASPPAAAQAPPPSSPDPTTAEIEAVDTLDEARAILRDIRAKMPTADDVRYASLAEKALSAINRIEQIEAKRPRPPARDEVQEAIRGKMDECVAFLSRYTGDAAAAFTKGRAELDAWALRTLGPALAAEHRRLVGAMLGEAAA